MLRLRSRIERVFPEFPEEVRRPAIFSLWFWVALAAGYAIWALDLLGTDPDNGFLGVGQGWDLVPGTLAMGVLAVVWLLMPWDPQADRRRRLAAPAFLLAVFAMNLLLGGFPGGSAVAYYSFAFYPLAIANGVFLFGFGRGIRYAAGVLAVVFADALLSIRLDFPGYVAGSGGWSVGNALGMAAVFVPVGVLLIGFCAPIVEANRRREETESLLGELEAAHARLESAHAELREYAARVGELAVSEERGRMAGEMHDSVGHYLTVVNVQLENATRFVGGNPERSLQEISKAKGLASEALSEVRRAVRALEPPAIRKRPVGDALLVLIRDFEGTGPSVSFSVEGEERALPTDAELVLYRALQECLTNALKHANARQVSVLLSFGERSVRLAVTDDGGGAPDGAAGEGFGLSALGSRANALGGSLKAGNAPEGGFATEVEVPTSAEEPPTKQVGSP